MNNRQIVASLNQIANELDSLGKIAEANEITKVMVKISQQSIFGPNFTNTGNYVPLGLDQNMTNIPSQPGYAKEAESAQSWINKKSQSVGGDIFQLISMAEAGKKSAQSETERKKFNDALYILSQNPKYKKYLEEREKQLSSVKFPGYTPR